MQAWLLWDNVPASEGMTGADLIPSDEHMALTCMSVAGGSTAEFERLYNEVRWSEVIRLSALQVASRWRDPYEQEAQERKRQAELYGARHLS